MNLNDIIQSAQGGQGINNIAQQFGKQVMPPGNIEAGGRFIQQQHIGPARQRHDQ